MTRYDPLPIYDDDTSTPAGPQQPLNNNNNNNNNDDDDSNHNYNPFHLPNTLLSSSSPTSTSSSFFVRPSHSFLPDFTNAIRTRASSIVSISTSSLRSGSSSRQSSEQGSDSSAPLMPLRISSPSSSPSSNLGGSLSSPGRELHSGSNNNNTDNSNCSSNTKTFSTTPLHVIRLRWMWVVALLLGEHGSYWIMVNRCAWPESSSWDRTDGTLKDRYRMAIIADPQLTDWMSYHQSGLVLALVEMYTDIFMKRSFRRLHASLRPDAVLFLGDLNDGGRITNDDTFEKNKGRFLEWVFSTRSSAWNQQPIVTDAVAGEEDVVNSNARKRKRQELTKEEKVKNVDIPGHYRQRVEAPLDANERESIRRAGKSLRLYVAGNHDVGFGDTLIQSSMARYKQVFGSVNYEVKVGNHSLVVLDTLALSSQVPAIRDESQQFLDHIKQESPTLPRILFTHVPLYRLDTTYCGKERETRQPIMDRKGDQYQNMVSNPLSREILEGIQPDMVFSGDDHDWCEVAHPTMHGNLAPEVTLRTFSFAQGIQQPAFAMMSLFNPDLKAKNIHPVVPTAQGLPVSNDMITGSVERPSGDTTFMYDECMLPNQMMIYLCYGVLLAVSLNWILIQQYWWMVAMQRGWSLSILGRWRPFSNSTNSRASNQQLDIATEQELYFDEPIGPMSLSTANNGKGKQLSRRWPLFTGLFWKRAGRHLWDVVRYVIPFYTFLFVWSII